MALIWGLGLLFSSRRRQKVQLKRIFRPSTEPCEQSRRKGPPHRPARSGKGYSETPCRPPAHKKSAVPWRFLQASPGNPRQIPGKSHQGASSPVGPVRGPYQRQKAPTTSLSQICSGIPGQPDLFSNPTLGADLPPSACTVLRRERRVRSKPPEYCESSA